MDSKFMVGNIGKDIRNKLAIYYSKGFDSRDLIILLPTNFYDVLFGYFENELIFKCESSEERAEIKSYIYGIEVKPASGLDDIYVSFKSPSEIA